MRLIPLTFAMLAGLALPVPAAAAPYAVDRSHAFVTFTADHPGFSTVHGVIDRTEWGMTFGAPAIGAQIPIRIDLEISPVH
jgi:polyisoprenoid-binding protein YceI